MSWLQRLCVWFMAVATTCGAFSSVAASERPNIIVILIDDLGYSDLSCFGGDGATTACIDSLATEGLRFTSFYVNSPICSPSRVALSTGQYPQRWRIGSFLSNRRANRRRGMDQWLAPEAPMLARQLQAAGYRTGHFGKWHMGGQRDVGDAPLISEYGFDTSLTNFEGLGPRILPLKDAFDGKPPVKHALGSDALGRGPIRWADRSVITAAFVQEAIQFIDDAQEQGEPFYLNLWPDDVHSPFFPPAALRAETDESKRKLYYAVLDAMDQQLGVLFERIRDDDALRENTLILILSDNGHEAGAGQSTPLRGGKTMLFEGGVRSPLIAWGPGLLDKQAIGETNHDTVFCALDLNRSLYTIADVRLPSGHSLDGEDLAETLLGSSQQGRRDPICWRRPPDRPGTAEDDYPDLAIRSGEWKFYLNFDGSNPMLYNLRDDISETTNLVSEHAEIAERLQAFVETWNAALPKDAGDPDWKR